MCSVAVLLLYSTSFAPAGLEHSMDVRSQIHDDIAPWCVCVVCLLKSSLAMLLLLLMLAN